MCDCDRLRLKLVGLPRCCTHCRARGAHDLLVDGEPMVLCCHVVCSVMTRYGASVEFGPSGQLAVNSEPSKGGLALTGS